MACAAMLLLAPPPERVRRAAWAVLALAGVASGLALNAHLNAPASGNYIHYYLGAKYPIRYDDFYRVIQAGCDSPQVGMRDLTNPRRYVRRSTGERRAYFIDLLRARRVEFDPLAPLETLADQAQRSGAVTDEDQRILRDALPARTIAPFERDVRRAVAPPTNRPVIDDYGFNGSPFYVLLRHLDPALHVPFDSRLGTLGLLWQLLGALLFASFVGVALGLSPPERLASAALLLISWDFAGWAMPGLVFGEVWAPIAIAAFTLHRSRPMLAGVAIAWAGMVKLFPFAMLLPALAQSWRALRGRPGAAPQAAWAPRLLASCAAVSVLLAVASGLWGRSWLEFLGKIRSEFVGVRMLNNVSFEQGLQTIGVAHTSWLRPVISIVALAFLGAMFVSDRESDRGPTLARRALLLMGAMGFVAGSWLNYYAVVPLLLLPFYARRHRVAVAALAGGFALAFLLPEFDARVLKTQPALRLLKLLPYWIAPAWMVATELRQIPWSPRVKRLAMVAGVAVAVLITIEAGRNVVSRSNERQAEALLASGQTARAAEKYQSAIQLTPEDGTLRMSGAVALMLAGESRAARAQFGRAVELSPDDAVIRDNFGRMLMMERNWSEAAAQLEIARRLEPGDSEVLASLAQARWALGEREEAVKLLLRAREIDPGNRNVQEALLAIERDAKRAGAK